jgi:two-component system response regulator HydG
MVNVLLIDDDPQEHRTLKYILTDPYVLCSAYTARQGIEIAEREGPDVVLLDINLPDMDGIAALRSIVARPSAPPVVMLTGLSQPRIVKEAILAGACDYVVKPYEPRELLGTLRCAVGGADARRAASEAAARVPGNGSANGLIGESAAMREVQRLILRYAPSDSPVLVTGESGTGKELVARSIHGASRRNEGPFVALNCGAIPETLLESELFGAERGAFTDAVSRPGSFEQANGGTLFLDEVGEMPLAAQTRLLRVIEQKELTRVGGARVIALDVRVVSATNREPKADLAAGRFRADLYYRLGVLPIHVPALRERREDIPVLAAFFLARLARATRPATSASAASMAASLADDAREKLRAHDWPGNVRELRSVMERAVLAAEGGTVRARDVSFD